MYKTKKTKKQKYNNSVQKHCQIFYVFYLKSYIIAYCIYLLYTKY